MKPIIGVTPLYDEKKSSVWMIPGYLNGIIQAGGIPMIIPYSTNTDILEEVCNYIDGVILTGGGDIDPLIYSNYINNKCGGINKFRDKEEIYIIKKMIEMDKPLLGICRGMQLLNIVGGGELYQDLDEEFGSKINHNHKEDADKKGSHFVNIVENSKLYNAIKNEQLCVNSIHHQGIKKIAKGAIANAISEDGLVEGIEFPKLKFALGIQWHPELMYNFNNISLNIFRLLTKYSARERIKI